MKIGGFQETSLLDYPGKIAAIIWTTGCNFRCPFCYNPNLVFDNTDHISVDEVFSFLQGRVGKLDAVSISGGEPFLQKDLTQFIKKIKDFGFLVKIDTNGMFPSQLQALLDESLVDYVSMDVKSSKEKYHMVAGVSVDSNKIDQSIQLIKRRADEYEFKTTVLPRFHLKDDIISIAQWLKGSKRYFLQQFKSDTHLISPMGSKWESYSKAELFEMCELIKPYFHECNVRGV